MIYSLIKRLKQITDVNQTSHYYSMYLKYRNSYNKLYGIYFDIHCHNQKKSTDFLNLLTYSQNKCLVGKRASRRQLYIHKLGLAFNLRYAVLIG